MRLISQRLSAFLISFALGSLKDINNKVVVFLRKVISANLYWYDKVAYRSDFVRDSTIDRIVSAILAKYDVVEKEPDHKE